jgi:hypothetical protein
VETFIRGKDFILTRDAWRIIMELNIRSYEDAISIIREGVMLVHRQRKEFTPVSELKQIECMLNALECRMSYFYQLLPRLDNRRGIMNLGGTVLKSLFRVALAADVDRLHKP